MNFTASYHVFMIGKSINLFKFANVPIFQVREHKLA